MVVDPLERFLFSGSADGRIFMTPFDVGLMKEASFDSEDQKLELNGHKYVFIFLCLLVMLYRL